MSTTSAYVQKQLSDQMWSVDSVAPDVTGLARPLTIYTVNRKSIFIKWQWHGDKDTFCPPKWVDIAIGSGACGFQCRTCFLMLTFRVFRDPSSPLVYTNYGKMDLEVKNWLMGNGKYKFKRTQKDTIGLGIDCSDSLLLEGYTENVRRLAPFFQNTKSNPFNSKLILLTKSANTHFLSEVRPDNIVVTMSLNPEGIADLWEGKYADGVKSYTSHQYEAGSPEIRPG